MCERYLPLSLRLTPRNQIFRLSIAESVDYRQIPKLPKIGCRPRFCPHLRCTQIALSILLHVRFWNMYFCNVTIRSFFRLYFSGKDLKSTTTYLYISVVLTRKSTPPTCVMLQWYCPEGQYHLPVQCIVVRRDSYNHYYVVCGCPNIHVHISCSCISYRSILQHHVIMLYHAFHHRHNIHIHVQQPLCNQTQVSYSTFSIMYSHISSCTHTSSILSQHTYQVFIQ